MPPVTYPCVPDRILSSSCSIPSVHLRSAQSNATRYGHYQKLKPSKNFVVSSQVIPDPLHLKSCKNLGYSSAKNLRSYNPLPTEGGSKSQPCKFFATCSPGLEQAVAAELASSLVGASSIKEGSGGVNFEGTFATGYKANLWLRCAIRVLLELGHAEMSKRDGDPVYSFVRNAVDWPQYLASSTLKKSGLKAWKFRSFAVQSRVWDCTRVTSSMSASTRAKDAICDALRDACNNRRPEPPEGGGAMADVPLFLSLYKNFATIYRDMSGISLHRRGYRAAMHKASLSEAVAAGILTLAGWNTSVEGLGYANKNNSFRSLENIVLLDPMCGSGTFLIEAALMAANKAPGMMRTTWPFKSWHDFNSVMWRECCENAASAETVMPKGLRILGNDKHEGALSLCARDADAAGIKYALELSCKDCREYIPSVTPSLVVVNPPWGYRLGNAGENDNDDVESTWQALGLFSKQYCNCADMYILSGRSTVTRELCMKADKKWPITMGGIDCRLLHYYVLPPKVGINTDTDYKQVTEVKEATAR